MESLIKIRTIAVVTALALAPAVFAESQRGKRPDDALVGGKASPVRAESVQIGYLIVTILQETDHVTFSFHSDGRVTLLVDLNQNGVLDPSDVSYGVRDRPSPRCVGLLRNDDGRPGCGGLVSASTVEVRSQQLGNLKWRIPKIELAPAGAFQFAILIRSDSVDGSTTRFDPGPTFKNAQMIDFVGGLPKAR